MREHRRHPFFENLVFALAALLAAILIYYGVYSWVNARAARPQVTAGRDIAPQHPPMTEQGQAQIDISKTERGVSQAPSVKVSSPARRTKRETDIPLPH